MRVNQNKMNFLGITVTNNCKGQYNFEISEAVARRCSVKKVFSETLQTSQENTCARVSFLTKLRPATLFKKNFNTSVFL